MNIPEQAIEAASRAMDPGLWEFLDLHHDSDSAGWQRMRNAGLADARTALEAAASYLAAQALRDAADYFESHVGVTEFAEQSERDGVPWAHVHEDWEHQGPYMDWLRNRADELEQS